MAQPSILLSRIYRLILWAGISVSLLNGPNASAQTDQAQAWKAAKIEELDSQIAELRQSGRSATELEAQHRWLSNWNPGEMKAEPVQSPGELPRKRVEPDLQSATESQVWASIDSNASESDDGRYQLLKNAACCHFNDVAVQQAFLHWMDDDPTRRKGFLYEIESTTASLICLLKRSIECCPNSEYQLALEFTRYRRARALAYRELPDVVAKHPIKDPERLQQQIKVAFDELIHEAGSGRTEFVLLEIRMLRRAGERGRALELLEKFGPTVLPKWYQKKRRDLLKELGWIPPHEEAAAIFAKDFPEEVAKEQAR